MRPRRARPSCLPGEERRVYLHLSLSLSLSPSIVVGSIFQIHLSRSIACCRCRSLTQIANRAKDGQRKERRKEGRPEQTTIKTSNHPQCPERGIRRCHNKFLTILHEGICERAGALLSPPPVLTDNTLPLRYSVSLALSMWPCSKFLPGALPSFLPPSLPFPRRRRRPFLKASMMLFSERFLAGCWSVSLPLPCPL